MRGRPPLRRSPIRRGECAQFVSAQFLLLFQSSCDAVEQVSVILQAGPCQVVRLAEEGVDFLFLRSTRLRRPAEASVVTPSGLAHDEGRQPGPDCKVAHLTGSTGAGSAAAGAEDD